MKHGIKWVSLAGLLLVAGGAHASPASAMHRAPDAIDRMADPIGAAVAWRKALPGLQGVARGRALWNLAAALVAGSDSASALPLLEEAATLLSDPKATAQDRARVFTSQGSALGDLNRLDEADAKLDRGIALWRTIAPGGSAEEASALMVKATIAFSRGDLDAAKRIGGQAMTLFARLRLPDSAEQTGALADMSTIYLQARELEKSEAFARDAIAMASRSLPEDHPVAIVALTDWVAVLAAQGRRAESVEILQRIAKLRERRFGPDYGPLAITFNNLSRNLMFLQRAAEAEPYARRAVAIAAKTRSADDQGLASMRDNLADILVDLGRTAESMALRREAIAGLGTTGDKARIMRIRRSLAVTLSQSGDDSAALPEFEAVSAWNAATRPPDNPDRLQAESELATVEARLGRPEANPRMRATLDLVERNLFAAGDASRRASSIARQLEHMLEVAWLTHDRTSGFRIAQLMALDEAGRAIAAVSMRAAAGDGAGGALVRKRQDLLAERDKQSRAALRAFGKGEADYRTAAAAVASIDADLVRTEQALSGAFPAYAAFASFKPIDEAEIARNLHPDQALVMLAPLGQRAVTFVVRRNKGDWALSPKDQNLPAELTAIRQSLGGVGGDRSAVPDARAARPAFDPAQSHRLYRGLIPASLDPVLRGASNWLVAAGGAFSGLPLAVLVTETPANGKTAWLIRKTALSVVPALSSIRVQAARGVPTGRFVGIGAPALGGTAVPDSVRSFYRGGTVNREALAGLAPLPHAKAELERMEAALPGLKPTLLTGTAATETAVKTGNLHDVRLLAFATHGLVGGAIDADSEPGLVLTPPVSPTAQDDGLLTASEIAALDIDADWVVLSACDTAAGDSPGAPALSGLARAFLYAGARALLVSHWAVRDDVAARLTVDTVTRANKGEDRAQALRHAMLRLIDDPTVTGSGDPSVWAPFILVTR